MALQPERQHGPQPVQRACHQCAGQVNTALMVSGMGACSELAGVLQVRVRDHPGQPSAARLGVVLEGLGIGRGQWRVNSIREPCKLATLAPFRLAILLFCWLDILLL